MKVLVTGQTGQLVQALLARGRIDHGIGWVALGRPELDFTRPRSIEAAVSSVAPDVIVNAAAYTAVDQAEGDPETAFMVNGEAAGVLASAGRRQGARIIQISTDYVFDGEDPLPYSEHAQPNPVNVYGRSKLEGEERVRSEIPDGVIVRTAWLYSAYGRNFVKTILALSRSQARLRVVCDQHGNPTSAADLADGLLVLLDRWGRGEASGLGRTYHLAGAGSASWHDFAEEILRNASGEPAATATAEAVTTTVLPGKARRPANSTLDCSGFEADFGFRMPRWTASLHEAIQPLLNETGRSS